MSELGQAIIEAVRKHANERPNYVYRSPVPDTCLYVNPDGSRSCLLGHALVDLKLLTREPDVDSRDKPIGTLARIKEWPIDRDELYWLAEVQEQQDASVSWGQAVSYADDPD